MLCSKAWVLQHGLHVCVGNGVLIIDGALHEAWDMLGEGWHARYNTNRATASCETGLKVCAAAWGACKNVPLLPLFKLGTCWGEGGMLADHT